MKQKMRIGNFMDLEILAENLLISPDENFKNLLPHYKNMLDTGIVDNVLFEKLKQSQNSYSQDFTTHMFTFMLREDYISQYGYVLLNNKLLESLSDLLKNKKVLEVGAGSGFLSFNLQNLGVDIMPVDYKNLDLSDYGFHQEYTSIVNTDAVEYLKTSQKNNPYDIVIMSWPCLGSDFANDILKAMKKGQKLIYVGESFGGCTANNKFFNSLENKTELNEMFTKKLQEYSLTYRGLHDDWYVYDIK